MAGYIFFWHVSLKFQLCHVVHIPTLHTILLIRSFWVLTCQRWQIEFASLSTKMSSDNAICENVKDPKPTVCWQQPKVCLKLKPKKSGGKLTLMQVPPRTISFSLSFLKWALTLQIEFQNNWKKVKFYLFEKVISSLASLHLIKSSFYC